MPEWWFTWAIHRDGLEWPRQWHRCRIDVLISQGISSKILIYWLSNSHFLIFSFFAAAMELRVYTENHINANRDRESRFWMLLLFEKCWRLSSGEFSMFERVRTLHQAKSGKPQCPTFSGRSDIIVNRAKRPQLYSNSMIKTSRKGRFANGRHLMGYYPRVGSIWSTSSPEYVPHSDERYR